MILPLPEPVKGQTHVKLYRLDEVVGSWVEARGYLGTMDGTDFEKADGLRDVLFRLLRDEYDHALARAERSGAPTGEFRKADLLRYVFDPETDSDFTWI